MLNVTARTIRAILPMLDKMGKSELERLYEIQEQDRRHVNLTEKQKEIIRKCFDV